MRLYATTTSERASKGQGGNDYIAIKLQAGEDRETFVRLYFHESADGKSYEILNEDTDEIIYTKLKGKRQKGENCNGTGKHTNCKAIVNCLVCKNDPLLN